MPDTEVVLVLCAAALVAGWVDAVAGGGGLVQLPALLVLLPGAAPAQILATNKLSSVFGTATAAAVYARRVRLDLRTALPMAATALGGVQRLRFAGTRHLAAALGAAAGIGFYDGIFGPGTGSFLVFALVVLMGYSFVQASAKARIVNLATNLGALAVFIPQGAPMYGLGLSMAACNVLGGRLGAVAAISRGSRFVRVVFLLVVGVLTLRLAVDVLRGA